MGETKVGNKERGYWKVAFWNVAGLGNKDQEFWEGLRGVGCISNVGNVGRYREVERGEGKSAKGYEWAMQEAKKENKKGRAIRGIIIGDKKGSDRKGNGNRVGTRVIDGEKGKVWKGKV